MERGDVSQVRTSVYSEELPSWHVPFELDRTFYHHDGSLYYFEREGLAKSFNVWNKQGLVAQRNIEGTLMEHRPPMYCVVSPHDSKVLYLASAILGAVFVWPEGKECTIYAGSLTCENLCDGPLLEARLIVRPEGLCGAPNGDLFWFEKQQGAYAIRWITSEKVSTLCRMEGSEYSHLIRGIWFCPQNQAVMPMKAFEQPFFVAKLDGTTSLVKMSPDPGVEEVKEKLGIDIITEPLKSMLTKNEPRSAGLTSITFDHPCSSNIVTLKPDIANPPVAYTGTMYQHGPGSLPRIICKGWGWHITESNGKPEKPINLVVKEEDLLMYKPETTTSGFSISAASLLSKKLTAAEVIKEITDSVAWIHPDPITGDYLVHCAKGGWGVGATELIGIGLAKFVAFEEIQYGRMVNGYKLNIKPIIGTMEGFQYSSKLIGWNYANNLVTPTGEIIMIAAKKPYLIILSRKDRDSFEPVPIQLEFENSSDAPDNISAACLSPTDPVLYLCDSGEQKAIHVSYGGKVKSWKLKGTNLGEISVPSHFTDLKRFLSIAISPDSKFMYIAYETPTREQILCVNLETRVANDLLKFDGNYSCLQFVPNGNLYGMNGMGVYHILTTDYLHTFTLDTRRIELEGQEELVVENKSCSLNPCGSVWRLPRNAVAASHPRLLDQSYLDKISNVNAPRKSLEWLMDFLTGTPVNRLPPFSVGPIPFTFDFDWLASLFSFYHLLVLLEEIYAHQQLIRLIRVHLRASEPPSKHAWGRGRFGQEQALSLLKYLSNYCDGNVQLLDICYISRVSSELDLTDPVQAAHYEEIEHKELFMYEAASSTPFLPTPFIPTLPALPPWNHFKELYDHFVAPGATQDASFISISASLKDLKANFSLAVVDLETNETESISVHDWVLNARWEFFGNAFKFGGAELKARQLTLPAMTLGFSTLKKLVKYIYFECLQDLDVDDCSSLLLHSGLFGFFDAHQPLSTSSFAFRPLVKHCLKVLERQFDLELAECTDDQQKEQLRQSPYFMVYQDIKPILQSIDITV